MQKLTLLAAVVGMSIGALLPGTAAFAEPLPGLAATAVSTSYEIVLGEEAESKCYTQLDGEGPVGGAICGTYATTMRFDDGTKRKFIIGWDRAVWNIVKYPNGVFSSWRSLGGWAQVGVFPYIFDSRYPNDLTISTVGRDGRDWCRALHGSWWPWGLC